jgi:ATP-dependent DNA helicase RecG
LNAIAHKDYGSGNPIQIKVYKDRINLWNAGQLPDNLTLDNLLTDHPSIPYNPDIATTFFRAGLIEAGGRLKTLGLRAYFKTFFETPLNH